MKTPIETVRTETFTMDYFRFGQGENVFVILPGLSVDNVMKYAGSVAKSYSLLSKDYTIYVFDRRKELPEPYSVYDMARDTAAALRALGLSRVCLFGASQGGMIAMTIAIEAPELVSKLVVGSTSARVTGETYEAIFRWIQLAKDGNAKDLYLAFGEALYPERFYQQIRGVLTDSAKGVTEEDLARFVILAEGTAGFNVLDRVHEIACPVLVIGSADDHVLGGAASEQIAEQLKDRPDCELYLYNGYGHAAYDLAPDYRKRVLAFCKAH